jgi:chemotaxis protein MotB
MPPRSGKAEGKAPEIVPDFRFGEASVPVEEDEGAPGWMTTFGDLMSLLLTFFVLMYSMSELKVERFQMARDSIVDAFNGAASIPLDPLGTPLPPGTPESGGGVPLEGSPPPVPMDDETILAIVETYMERIAQRLEEIIEENGLEETLSVIRHDDGVRLRILSTTLFPSGSAHLAEDKRWIVEILGEVTSALDVPAVVSGHTDNEPIRTAQFYSNWELSAARAAGVARELVAQGYDPSSIRVEAFGEFQPLADNTGADGRAQNRRVEILFSREDIFTAVQRWRAEGRGVPDVEE